VHQTPQVALSIVLEHLDFVDGLCPWHNGHIHQIHKPTTNLKCVKLLPTPMLLYTTINKESYNAFFQLDAASLHY